MFIGWLAVAQSSWMAACAPTLLLKVLRQAAYTQRGPFKKVGSARSKAFYAWIPPVSLRQVRWPIHKRHPHFRKAVTRVESASGNANQPLTFHPLKLGDVIHENSQLLENCEKFVH